MTPSPRLGAALAAVAVVLPSGRAFSPPPPALHAATASSTAPDATSTALHIIGPMIRKMREGNEEKNMPMANPDEARKEAPGLRVGEGAWKWPPVWPYDRDFFLRKAEAAAKKDGPLANPMANMMGGGASPFGSLPTGEGEEAKKGEEVAFDDLKWWEENEDVKTELDDRVAMRIMNHYTFYLRDGMSVLELGAAEESYLPLNLKLNRHVGVGAVQSAMEANPSIEESYVVDFNKVVDDEGVDSEEFEKLCDGTWDAVIMANTVDFLNKPREVFKSAWRALKPEGIMIVPFLAKDAYADKFDEAFTKQWRDMTDDQHMWVAGSFFQFSAGDGWEGLKGFDISPEDARNALKDEGVLGKLKPQDADAPCGAYVVQAKKRAMAEDVDAEGIEGYIQSRLWMMPTLEDRDKKLVVPRLARAYDALDSEEERGRTLKHFDSLPKIYASLVKMDQFAFTFSMQAQLAADLVGDPDFDGNDVQINNMKMGLGLRKPSKDFWAPVGRLTAAMEPEDKVNLLAYIVPRFGSDDPAGEESLRAFVTGLEPTFAVIRSKCPGMKEGDLQLLGSELLASEVLKPGRSTREEFAMWLGALSEMDLEFVLTKRKSYKKDVKREKEEFVEAREAEVKRVEERREKIQEQVMTARENRSVFFNPRTGKVEQMEKKDGFLGGFKLPGF